MIDTTKKAYLVDFSVITRVVTDPMMPIEEVAQLAIEKLLSNRGMLLEKMKEGFNVKEDTECPFSFLDKPLQIFMQRDTIRTSSIRYFCVGTTENGKLSGVVYGYEGGYEYSTWYVYKDKFLPQKDIYGDPVEDDVAVLMLNTLIGGASFVEKCYDALAEFANHDDENCHYKVNKKGKKAFGVETTTQLGESIEPLSYGLTTFPKTAEHMTLEELRNELGVDAVLKETVEQHMRNNSEEELSDATLITMTLKSICEDALYGCIVDGDEAETYLQKIATAVEENNSTFYKTNIRECEVCSHCGKVLLPHQECYESHNGLPLCSACSYRCECCDQYFVENEVTDSPNGYCCEKCNEQPAVDNKFLSVKNFLQVQNFLTSLYEGLGIMTLQTKSVMSAIETEIKEIEAKGLFDKRFNVSKNISVLVCKSRNFEVYVSIEGKISTYESFKRV